jgi:hypothetical protein
MAKKHGKRSGETRSLTYWDDLPFKGELPFDLTFTLFGTTVTRKAKVVFAHAPDGEYYDIATKALKKSILSTRYHIELLTVPSVRATPRGSPCWVDMQGLIENDVLSDDVYDALLDAIGDWCAAEDAKRRKAVGL